LCSVTPCTPPPRRSCTSSAVSPAAARSAASPTTSSRFSRGADYQGGWRPRGEKRPPVTGVPLGRREALAVLGGAAILAGGAAYLGVAGTCSASPRPAA